MLFIIYKGTQTIYCTTMLKNFYKKFRDIAASKNAMPVLALISFYDAWLFPTPPEVMLLPTAAMQPQKAYKAALVATIASVLGGILGYFIGLFLMDTIGQAVLGFIGLGEKLPAIKAFYAKWGTLAILIKGLTPFPFMVISIFSGSVKFPFAVFVAASAITRGVRFFGVAWAAKKYGASIESFIEKQLYWITGAVAVVIIIGAVLYSKFSH